MPYLHFCHCGLDHFGAFGRWSGAKTAAGKPVREWACREHLWSDYFSAPVPAALDFTPVAPSRPKASQGSLF